MAKLTDRQRKQIIAEYVAGDGKVSQRELAKRYHVSQKTISTILGDKKTTQKVSHKKKENEMSMLAFLDSRTSKAQELIDMVLESLPSDFENAGMKQKAGLLKILAETFGGKNGDAPNGEKSDQPTFNFVFSDVSMKEKDDEK